MAVIMENYANQLAEQYGDDVASEVLTRAKNKPVGTTSFGTSTAIGSYGAPSQLAGATQSDSTPSGYNSQRTSGFASYGGSTFPLGTMNSAGYGGFATEDGRRT